MQTPEARLQSLRERAFEGGHRFAARIDSRLEEVKIKLHELSELIPEVRTPAELANARIHLQSALLPLYQEVTETALAPDELASAFGDWMSEMDQFVADWPAVLEDEEPERLYQPSSADGAFTATRKGLIRLTRSIGTPPETRIREVPVGALGQAFVREWLPVQFGKVLDDDRKRVAQVMARLERTLSDLVYAILRAENRWQLSLVAQSESTVEGSLTSNEGDSSQPVQEDIQPAEISSTVLEPVHQAEQRFRASLHMATEALSCNAATDVERRLEQAWVPLESETYRAGSFMSAIPLIEASVFAKRLERIGANASDWQEWKTRLQERSRYFHALISLRTSFHELVDRTQHGVEQHLVQPIRRRTSAVATRLGQTEQELAAGPRPTEGELFTNRTGGLQSLGEEAVRRVQEELVEPIQELSLLTRIPDENQAFLDGLADILEAQPVSFRVHPLSSDVDVAIGPQENARIIALQEIARNGTVEIDADELTESSQDAKNGLRDVLEELVNLPSIVRFSFEAAADEGQDDVSEGSETSPSESDQLVSMMLESLRRTRDAISTIGGRIDEGATLLTRVYRRETFEAWTRIQDRLEVEHQVGAYVMDVRSRFDAEAREAGQRLTRLSRQTLVLFERLFHRGHREARALIERGKEAVGTPSPTRASFHETALGLAELEAVLEGVPTVYRKLFSFQPLTDADLLIGRVQSLTFIENQLEQFDLGMPQAAMLVGGPSSGRTSLLNVLKATHLADRDVRMTRFEQRPRDPKELLAFLGSTLGLPIPEVDTVSDAARALSDALEDMDTPICMVEHLECLMLRGIGGYDLLVDVLQLMSLTDSRIIWIGTISSFAWQILKTADPDSAALVSQHTMTELTRTELERLIMERHRKSGIPLEFILPEEPSPLLRRKLRRVTSRERRQPLLREAFFDRLFTQFGQNIQMALLQWIRSVSMTEDGGSMRVSHVPALNLSFFSGFNMDQVFALKALLEHGSLTPDEYAQIDRLAEDKALTLFETLGNALVIETTAKREAGSLYRHAAVDAGQSYRIRPLFSHAVIRLLRQRNVVH